MNENSEQRRNGVDNECLNITKKYVNLQETLEAFYKRPIDEIYVESTQEVDVGDPVGNEQW